MFPPCSFGCSCVPFLSLWLCSLFPLDPFGFVLFLIYAFGCSSAPALSLSWISLVLTAPLWIFVRSRISLRMFLCCRLPFGFSPVPALPLWIYCRFRVVPLEFLLFLPYPFGFSSIPVASLWIPFHSRPLHLDFPLLTPSPFEFSSVPAAPLQKLFHPRLIPSVFSSHFAPLDFLLLSAYPFGLSCSCLRCLFEPLTAPF